MLIPILLGVTLTLVLLCLLAVGHLHNEVATLRRRHQALVLSVEHLASSGPPQRRDPQPRPVRTDHYI